MKDKIIMYTDKDVDHNTIRFLKSFFDFHGADFQLHDQGNDSNTQCSYVIVDQFIDFKLGIHIIPEIREQFDKAKLFYLNAHDLIKQEEDFLQKYHISLLSLPLDEDEIFNRMIR